MRSAQNSRMRRMADIGLLSLLAFVVIPMSVAAIAGHVRAEDPQPNLPKNGSWVRYRKVVEDKVTGRIPGEISVTMSMTGTVVEDGQACRWVEWKSVARDGADGREVRVLKVLVPEKDFWESDKPFENARRAWILKPDAPAYAVPAANLVGTARSVLQELMLWTPGMRTNARIVQNDQKDIEYQRGRLVDAVALRGKLFMDQGTKTVKTELAYTAWQHSDLSFGSAEVQIIAATFVNAEVTPSRRISVAYYLQDAGTDAKSELPDNN